MGVKPVETLLGLVKKLPYLEKSCDAGLSLREPRNGNAVVEADSIEFWKNFLCLSF